MRTLDRAVLAINYGSSSIKLTLFDGQQPVPRRLLDIQLSASDGAPLKLAIHSSKGSVRTTCATNLPLADGLQCVFDELKWRFAIELCAIGVIGHRFVHGGPHYVASTILDKAVVHRLEKLAELAPLHNAASLAGVKACYVRGAALQVAVFDTAFYSALPAVAANYAIEHRLMEKYGIKRYGFHGISHASLWMAYARENPATAGSAKIVTLHLGSGCSATAIDRGQPIDTSMGFTPAEGLIMATRAGDVDAGIVEFLCTHEKMTPVAVMQLLNAHSGLLGVSGVSADMASLVAVQATDRRARLAIEMFCYRILKYIGGYMAALGGIEALVFSGGIGENSSFIRQLVCQQMAWCGWKMDGVANQQAAGLFPATAKKISAADSSVALYVIATDENLIIAKEALTTAASALFK